MTNILLNNSYQILGLDITSSQREILKRAKEISNLLKIDNIPEYDLDLGLIKNLRTETTVRQSLQNLSDPKKRIKEYFFWFEIQDSVDEEAINKIKSSNYSKAIQVWENESQRSTSKSLFYKKNLAILYLLLLLVGDSNEIYLKNSITIWEELIKSEKFWSIFAKSYSLNDDLNTNQEIITAFKGDSVDCLADIYTELKQKFKNNKYITEFASAFGAKGESLEKDILNPIYNIINNKIETLDAIEIKENSQLDESTYSSVINSVQSIQMEFYKLKEMKLFDSSQSKIMRDKAASSIRGVVLKLYNNLRETEKSSNLLNTALEICGTAGLENKIKNDIKTLEKNKKDDKIIEPVLDLEKKEKYDEALTLIEKDRVKHKDNVELQEFYTNHKKLCITIVASQKYKQANDYWVEKQFDASKQSYEEVINLLSPNLDLYNFNRSAIDQIVEDIKIKTSQLTTNNISQLDQFRSEIAKIAQEKFEGQMEYSTLICYLDSYIYSLAIPFIKKTRRNNTWKNVIIGGAIFIGLIFFGSNSKGTSTSTPDCSNIPAGQYCCSSENSTQADNLKPDSSIEDDLCTKYTKINNERSYLDNTDQVAIDAFNVEVDQYNKEKDDYKNKLQAYNNFLAQNCTLK